MFKAYDGSRLPPSQYSRVSRDHDIKEYLSEQQLMAYSKRYSKRDDSADMFSDKSPFGTSSAQRKPGLLRGSGSGAGASSKEAPAAASQ
jgi:hypothetical protein